MSARRLRAVAGLCMLVAMTSPARGEVCPNSKVKKAILAQYDSHLNLSQAETQAAVGKHLPFGVPVCDKMLPLKEFIVCYDPEKRIPRWVGYELTAAEVITKERRDAFRTDPRLSDEETAHCADYKGSGFDRGHSVPRDDMNRRFEVQADTFLLSNMSPQAPRLNEGIWAWLEDSVRTWAKKFGQVYVISGPVFIGNVQKLNQRVGVPKEFFKIVVRRDANGDLEAQTFLLVNTNNLPIPPGGHLTATMTAKQADAYLVQHATSIDAIEYLTGLDFLSDLPKAKQTAVESVTISSLWPKQ